jgi:hypothetical protein
MANLTAARARDALHYDPETGKWTWLIRSGGKSTVGSPAGSLDPSGYWKISLDGKRYWLHRLAFLWMTGEWPRDQVDHINRQRADTRWANLREADRKLNMWNTRPRRRNRLGVKGVSQIPCGHFVANIYREGKSRYLGSFPTIEQASAAYARAGGIP